MKSSSKRLTGETMILMILSLDLNAQRIFCTLKKVTFCMVQWDVHSFFNVKDWSSIEEKGQCNWLACGWRCSARSVHSNIISFNLKFQGLFSNRQTPVTIQSAKGTVDSPLHILLPTSSPASYTCNEKPSCRCFNKWFFGRSTFFFKI